MADIFAVAICNFLPGGKFCEKGLQSRKSLPVKLSALKLLSPSIYVNKSHSVSRRLIRILTWAKLFLTSTGPAFQYNYNSYITFYFPLPYTLQKIKKTWTKSGK